MSLLYPRDKKDDELSHILFLGDGFLHLTVILEQKIQME